MKMSAATINLPVIEKGATYSQVLYWKDSANVAINLTGCTAKIQVRAAEYMPVIETFSTENGRIVITPLTGKIEIKMTDEDSRNLSSIGGIYALEIYHPDGTTTRLCEGELLFSYEVTV